MSSFQARKGARVVVLAFLASLGVFAFWHMPLSRADETNDNGELSGVATVADGDTLEIDGQLVNLFGIDAPELGQLCMNGTNTRWRCGLDAAFALKKLVNGKPVSCSLQSTQDFVPAGICRSETTDLADIMLRRGYVVATSPDMPGYVDAEKSAKSARLGLWRGEFVEPSAWRAGKRLVRGDGGPSEICDIKGIVSDRGNRVFYVPGDPQYNNVSLSAAENGERWFCSDDEARFAGWKHYGR